MSEFMTAFSAIEDSFNEKVRGFVESVQHSGLSWSNYELHERVTNQYGYDVRSLYLQYEPDLMEMLRSDSSEDRRVSLKVARDGLLDFSCSDSFVEKIINISIDGNEEEMLLARGILASRGWTSGRDELVGRIVSGFCSDGVDYYTYKNVGEFLCVVGSKSLLEAHIKLGEGSQDEDIVELANDLSLHFFRG
ncbi:hypothetical protein P5705_25925 [Pseudomonas entomophila]|uniref:hypothetical protein n=1 Tax=Pseudomonas entomophila TaxID=312306 RepID=UPI00240639D2|nr:hypothetical protein [Pseudomonas entomophila]MDF9621096.1 hypothetical protein [Pseudomonas entomophila]